MAQVAGVARSFRYLLSMVVLVASALVASPPGSPGPGRDFYQPNPASLARQLDTARQAGLSLAHVHELFSEANRIYETGQANRQMEPFVARLTLGERALLLIEIDVRQTDRGPLRNPVKMAALRESVLVHIQAADARATGVDLNRIRRAVDRSASPAGFSPAERKILQLEEIIRGARKQHKTLREKVHALMEAQAHANLKAFNDLVVAGRYAEAEKFGRQNIPWGALHYDIAGRPIPLELPPGKLFPSDYKLRRDLLPALPKPKQSTPQAAPEAKLTQVAAKAGRPGEDPLHADFPGLAREVGPIQQTLEYAAAEDKAIKARVDEYNRLIIDKQWDRALRHGRAKLPPRLVNLDEKGHPLFIADFEMVRDDRHVGFKAQVVKSNDMMSWHKVTAVHEREASEFYEVTVEGMTKPIQGTPEHPVFIVGRGWVEIKDIRVGEKGVDQNGRHVKILAKKYVKLDKPVKVYNLTVEGAHSFFVSGGGSGGLLVHNAPMEGPGSYAQGAANSTPLKPALSYEQVGNWSLTGIGERFSNLFDGRGFNTDRQYIAEERELHGALGEALAVANLGYQNAALHETAAALIAVRNSINSDCECWDAERGAFDPARMDQATLRKYEDFRGKQLRLEQAHSTVLQQEWAAAGRDVVGLTPYAKEVMKERFPELTQADFDRIDLQNAGFFLHAVYEGNTLRQIGYDLYNMREDHTTYPGGFNQNLGEDLTGLAHEIRHISQQKELGTVRYNVRHKLEEWEHGDVERYYVPGALEGDAQKTQVQFEIEYLDFTKKYGLQFQN